MIACHSLHTHILCLIEHSLKEQLLNILFSSPLQCVAQGLMCCIIQALLWKQISYVSITAACCSSARVLPDFERIYFLNASIFHVCGKWTCAARLRSGLLRGFSHLWVCFPARCFPCPMQLSLLSSAAKLTPETSTQPSQKMRNSSLFMKKA